MKALFYLYFAMTNHGPSLNIGTPQLSIYANVGAGNLKAQAEYNYSLKNWYGLAAAGYQVQAQSSDVGRQQVRRGVCADLGIGRKINLSPRLYVNSSVRFSSFKALTFSIGLSWQQKKK